MANILICDDDVDIVSALKIYLSNEDYKIYTAFTGKQALDCVREHDIDLVLMDVMMPEMDGIETTAKLREEYNIPVILLTAKSESSDKVLGLNVGADDYVTKPFGMMELIARVKAVIRRCAGRGEGVLTLGGIRLDREKHTVEADGKEVVLTFREFELLRYLMEHPEKAFDRDRLLDEVWGAEYEGGPRTVDMHVQTIRKKLGRCASQIETIYGLGYKIGEGNNHAQ